MEASFIYSLKDPITGQVRYIGKTNNLAERLSAHRSKSRQRHNQLGDWLKSLYEKNLYPILEVLDVVNRDEWKFWETYWIWQFRSWGFDLKNGTYGGDGHDGFTPAVIKHFREINSGERNPMYGKKHTKESRAKIVKANTGKKRDTAGCRNIGLGKLGHVVTEDTRIKLAKAMKGKRHALGHIVSSAAKMKMSKAKLGKKHSEETKQKMRLNKNALGFKHSEETKMKMSEAKKGKKQTTLQIERRRESLRKYWADVKAGIIIRK